MTPEGAIVKQIRDYLKDRGYFTYNLQMVTPAGMPDMVVINPINGEHIYLEIKAKRGRLSKIQEHIHTKLRAFGCKVYTVKSLDRVKEIL